MDEKLRNACAGKTAKQGGLNVADLAKIAKSRGYSGANKRPDLINFLCTNNSPAKNTAATKKPAKATKKGGEKTLPPPTTLASGIKTHPQSLSIIKPKMPKLPRGQVGINSKEWTITRKPGTKAERKALHDRCGDDCFLIPEELKYPVCPKSGTCDYDCDGLRSAVGLAALINNRHGVSLPAKQTAIRAALRANDLGKRHCDWE